MRIRVFTLGAALALWAASAVEAAPTGACCFTTGGCLEVTQSFCTANGGSYRGDGTRCLPTPCGPPQSDRTRPLFAGVQYGSLATRRTDLSNFPNVTWRPGFVFELNGAAGRPDGALYLSSGDFNTRLYVAPIEGPVIFLCNLQHDVHGLAFGRGRLFGFSNFTSPMGIYEIDPVTGAMSLVVSTAGQGRRFFALDYNAADGLLYGYDEYGSPSGLVAINVDSGAMTHIAASVPASNSAGRGLACGDNKAYLVTVYGATVPMFVYDLSQGPGGTWAPFTHPYPDSNATSGAAWVRATRPGDLNCDGAVSGPDVGPFVMALLDPAGYAAQYPTCNILNGDLNGDGVVGEADVPLFVNVLLL